MPEERLMKRLMIKIYSVYEGTNQLLSCVVQFQSFGRLYLPHKQDSPVFCLFLDASPVFVCCPKLLTF